MSRDTLAIAGPSLMSRLSNGLRMLGRDRWALISAAFLLLLTVAAVLVAPVLREAATTVQVRGRNLPPFQFDRGWLEILGTDTLGRSILARLIVGSQNTLAIALSTVVVSGAIGSLLGLYAGLKRGWIAQLILRSADVIISLPSLLLAMVVLYVLGASPINVVIVLAVTRIPVFLRTVYAEVLEVRERMYVTAAAVLGASTPRLLFRHIGPALIPTLLTLATMDVALVMLTESGLSFLGLGLQPPEITWGLMVAEGRNYLAKAWWISLWPGLAITIVTLALSCLAEWAKMLNDPARRWQLEGTDNV